MTTIAIDVSGLLQWFAYNSQMTGIQRVSAEILRSETFNIPGVTFIARCPGGRDFFCVPKEQLSGLVGPKHLEATAQLRQHFIRALGDAELKSLLAQARLSHLPYATLGSYFRIVNQLSNKTHSFSNRSILPPLQLNPKVILGLGDFWCHRGHVSSLISLKQKTNAKLIHMVHDLFPLEHPEWAHPYYGQEFNYQFGRLAPFVDHWLVTSQFVKSQILSYLTRTDIADRPITPIPMGWDSFGSRRNDLDLVVLSKFGVVGRRYILCVGTIEPRKNIENLIDCMVKLKEVLGEETPRCLIVGQKGWRSAGVMSHLKKTGFARGTIQWCSSVSDHELGALYKGACFSVMPSFGEGWGLPVQESLAHGLPCIASGTGGLLEAGLNLAHYVNPHSKEELFRVMKHWLTDAKALSRVRHNIKTYLYSSNSLPTWSAAAKRVMNVCREALLPRPHIAENPQTKARRISIPRVPPFFTEKSSETGWRDNV